MCIRDRHLTQRGRGPRAAAALGKVSLGGHMIKVRTHLIVLAAALTALLLLPAAGLASPSPRPPPSSSPPADASASAGSSSPLVYRICLQSDVDNMNPFSTYNTIPWECFRVAYNFLTWYDADYKPAPDLADPVPTVANGGATDSGPC